jgi:Sec-independent protein secretion pathway component TatC
MGDHNGEPGSRLLVLYMAAAVAFAALLFFVPDIIDWLSRRS